MSEKKLYLIEKQFEPAGAYAESLTQLPGDEIDKTPALDIIIKERELTEEERREVESRDHIIEVVDAGKEATIPTPPEITVDSRQATPAQIRAHHGFDKAHASGFRGQGQLVTIIDTGIALTAVSKLGDRLEFKIGKISGEDEYDTHSGHGTWCIGAIAEAAPNAGIGSIKGLSTKTGSASYSVLIECLNVAVERKSTVISCSWGGGGNPDDLLSRTVNAIRGRGISVNCAAGNDQRGNTSYTADVHSPGCAVRGLTWGAGDIDRNLADFSSWGKCVDVRAHGVSGESWGIDGEKKVMSGTSMSTPYGAAGVAVGLSKGATLDEVEKAILASCGDTGYSVVQEGAGIMDIEYAVKRLGVDPAPPAEKPPTTYYPNLPRLSKSKVNDMKLPAVEDSVLTSYGVDRGVYFQKQG